MLDAFGYADVVTALMKFELLKRHSCTVVVEDFECPACRKMLCLDREKMLLLPKNLALENVVVRYQEERSRSLQHQTMSVCITCDDKCHSVDVCRQLPVPSVAADAVSPADVNCDLCDITAPPCGASWFCQQCNVAYCCGCLSKFHPQRGALAKHRIQPAVASSSSSDDSTRVAYCVDHTSEQASMFCDRCKLYVCHLCVCDGEGRHAGHKMLSPDAACTMIKVGIVH